MRKRSLFVFLMALSATAYASDPIPDLENHGQNVVASVEEGALGLDTVYQTTEEPMNAYLIAFTTDEDALMLQPNAAENREAFIANRALTRMWSTKFCTDELKQIMDKHGLDMVTGVIQDTEGEDQSRSIC